MATLIVVSALVAACSGDGKVDADNTKKNTRISR
jgi:uncharacterized membrane protein YebE (DUF533 family)